VNPRSIGRWRPQTQAWAIALVGLVVLLARTSDAFTHPQFIYEDAGAFWAPTYEETGLDLLTRPWAGFLRVSQRLIFLGARLAPPAVAPVFALSLYYAVIAGVAAFVASDRMRDAIPSRRVRLSIALFLFGGTATTEMLGSSLNVEWFLWIFVVCLCLATRPGRRTAAIETGAAVVVGLTGPIVVALIPVILWRLARRRTVLTVVLVACAAVQVATYLASSRRPALPSSAVESAYAVLRQTGSSLLGVRVGTLLDAVAYPWLLAFVGLVLVGTIVACLKWLPRRTAIALGWAAIASAIAGLVSVGAPALQSPGQNPRYFIMTAIVAAIAAAAAAERRSPVGIVLAGAIVLGCVGDLVVEPLPQGGWASESGCIGGSTACRVDVYPPQWSVDWPGLHRGYRAPTGFTREGNPSY
jgi:hypothetical protein